MTNAKSYKYKIQVLYNHNHSKIIFKLPTTLTFFIIYLLIENFHFFEFQLNLIEK